ncbi:LIM domain containing protein [Acanthamoeba castellanii str. Neff]|uniref:LIM domain containing protein n=1 Tax=Acanthamoeba castellanii (strain ATCC 30010 / Neff) TaxID=1257118 RepID=L8H7G5_ACACF|nr:LIM domain containing protein [Acanthamoeba castellanii str. Neff]ELR20426.1 LIM domain containing protein [Acanthamoeba castellanii str. Neff]
MNTPGDGDVTCWKCGHHYALQRKFCVQCGSKPTRPGSTPTGSPAPSTPPSPVVAPRNRAGTPFPTNIPIPASTPAPAATPSNSLALTGDYHVVSSGGQDRFYCTEDFIAANSPACAVCAQPITGTGAEDHTGAKYHLNCFACKRCGTPITNKYIVDSQGDLCCGHCHSSSPPGAAGNSSSSSSSSAAGDSSTFRCGVCAGELSGQVVGVGDTRYHKHCFVCPGCKADLTHIPFHLENGQLRCKKCLLTEKGEFCAACGQLIEEGALQAMTKLWHEHCFKCGDCASVIGAGQSYAAKGQTPICASCATKY